MFNTNTAAPKETEMNPYRFDNLPSSAAVTNLVTVLVSAWFVLAAGAILSDQHSEANLEHARTPSLVSEASPDAHFTIVVEAKRIPG